MYSDIFGAQKGNHNLADGTLCVYYRSYSTCASNHLDSF